MSSLPLRGTTVSAGSWPAAVAAAGVLRDLGATTTGRGETSGVCLDGVTVEAEPSTLADDWDATRLAALTGRPDGPALTPVGAPATLARGLTMAIRALGGTVDDGASLMGMRTDVMPLARGGTRSANGSARLLKTRDGWLAVNLARESDVELVPALIERALDGPAWDAVTTWAGSLSTADAVQRASLLGLAGAGLGEQSTTPAWRLTPWSSRATRTGKRPLVVNLGALWAGPLAAHVLHRSGADVIDVHTARSSSVDAPWHRRLHDGHRAVHLDLQQAEGRSRLRELLAEADVVVEASRPRALRQLGLDAESIMTDGRPRTWIRITGHPRTTERIAYGDDAAVAGGLVARDAAGPVFAGDAIADPLTGLTAAAIALACLREGGSWVADVVMSGVAARAAQTSCP